jgi:hypothetical protein
MAELDDKGRCCVGSHWPKATEAAAILLSMLSQLRPYIKAPDPELLSFSTTICGIPEVNGQPQKGAFDPSPR